jgi:hypothetical protein
MEPQQAKELLHIRAWLNTAAEIVRRGQVDYFNDALLQEAGDSLMMKSVKQLSDSLLPATSLPSRSIGRVQSPIETG